jgi:carbon storage regulator
MKGVVMLVLSRKVGERVCIGASVVVTVVDVHNGRVRLAFDAPSGVAIDREEVRQLWKRSHPEDQDDPVLIP